MIVGQRFGNLVVIEKLTSLETYRSWVMCLCDCGNKHKVIISNLKGGSVKSCGCFRKEKTDKMAKGNKWKQIPKGESGFKAIYRTYIRNAKNRNLDFELAPDEFKVLITKNCHYCNRPPSNTSRKDHNEWSVFMYNGLDRVDQTKGYTKDNVLPCCKRDNYIRNTFLTVEETEVAVKAIEEFRAKKCD